MTGRVEWKINVASEYFFDHLLFEIYKHSCHIHAFDSCNKQSLLVVCNWLGKKTSNLRMTTESR